MQPVPMERVWGGRRLAELFGRTMAANARIGESWELSDLPGGRTRVADGPLAGKTLRDLLETQALSLLGREAVACGWGRRFGLLLKFIDATDRLSVQVHADDAFVAAHEPHESGKHECWVILRAEPEAWLVHGLKAGVTRESFAAAVRRGDVEEFLQFRQVKVGDVIWVPAGTVHSIGPGIVLAEIQQSSDLAYRLYDWGRMGLNGKPRTLHVEEALSSLRMPGEVVPSGGRGKTAEETGLVIEHLVDCPAFSVSRIALDRRPWAGETHDALTAMMVLAGSARLATAEASMDIRAGDTLMVPADAGEYALENAEGLTVLVVAPPGKAPQR
jgi:mannose-6-phosphate isomerase